MQKPTGKAATLLEGVQLVLCGETPTINERRPLGTPPNKDESTVPGRDGKAAGSKLDVGVAESRRWAGPVGTIMDEIGAGVGVG